MLSKFPRLDSCQEPIKQIKTLTDYIETTQCTSAKQSWIHSAHSNQDTTIYTSMTQETYRDYRFLFQETPDRLFLE